MTPQDNSIAELLDAVRRGDRAAQEAVLVRYQPWLRLLARLELGSRLGAKLDPSDIVQQTLLEAHEGLPRFRGQTPAELSAWLRRILTRVLGHERRRYHGTEKRDAGREVSIEGELEDSSHRLANLLAASTASPSQKASANEQEILLADALARLSEDHREVLVLRHLEGLSHAEIAARMNRGAGAVRMLWVRALAALREQMVDAPFPE